MLNQNEIRFTVMGDGTVKIETGPIDPVIHTKIENFRANLVKKLSDDNPIPKSKPHHQGVKTHTHGGHTHSH